MAELEREEFIGYRPGARLRELLVAAGAHAGFEPKITLESNESERIRRLVARGMGVAILPRSDASASDQQLAVAHAGRVIPHDGPLYHVVGSIVGSRVQAHETLLR